MVVYWKGSRLARVNRLQTSLCSWMWTRPTSSLRSDSSMVAEYRTPLNGPTACSARQRKKLSHSACGSSGLPTFQVKRKEVPVSRNGPERPPLRGELQAKGLPPANHRLHPPSCVLFQQLAAALPLPSRGQGGCHLSSSHAGNTQYIHLGCSRSETQVCSQVMTLSPTGHTSHQVKRCDSWMAAKRSTHTVKKWLELCCLTAW